MRRIAAYIDESGDASLNIGDGASERFVVCAVIVEDSARIEVEAEAERIRAKHFQTGEMKSQKLTSESRRARVVRDLNELRVSTFYLVVEKAKIVQPGGFKYKKSFFKFSTPPHQSPHQRLRVSRILTKRPGALFEERFAGGALS